MESEPIGTIEYYRVADDVRERLARLEEREANVAKLRELLDIKLAAQAMALELQAKETERRLGDLNHENARIKEAQSMSIERSVYLVQHESVVRDIALVTRMVWIGAGAVMALEVLLKYVM